MYKNKFKVIRGKKWFNYDWLSRNVFREITKKKEKEKEKRKTFILNVTNGIYIYNNR